MKCDNCHQNEGVRFWRTGWWLCQKCYDEWSKREDEILKDKKLW